MRHQILSMLILAFLASPVRAAEPALASNRGPLKNPSLDCRGKTDGKQIRKAIHSIKETAATVARQHGDVFEKAAKDASYNDGAKILEEATADCNSIHAQATALIEVCHKICTQLSDDPQAQKKECLETAADVKDNMDLNNAACTMQAQNARKIIDATSAGSGGISEDNKNILGGVAMTAVAGGAMIAATSGGGGGGDGAPVDPAEPCSGAKAGKNAACNDVLMVACSQDPSDKRCPVFNGHYCKAGGSNAASPYCKSAKVAEFCDPAKNPGHNVCPACIQHNAASSATCAANPTSCLGQNSPEQIAEALKQCPGEDPVYSAAALTNSGTGGSVAVTGGGSMAVASVIGSGSAVTTAQALPADVVGSYGPSLFSMSSGTINDRRVKRQIGH